MSYLETKLIPEKGKIFKFWRRFVDDIFCILNKRQVEEALKILNSRSDSIKFTVEIEKNGQLPFLDLLVSRNGKKLSFEIFRKPTHVDSYIHFNSYNPTNHKYAVFNSLVNRMVKIPMSTENRRKEKKKIIEIGEQNGFERRKIAEIIKKIEYRNKIKEVTTLQRVEKEAENWAHMTYHPKLNRKFQKVFKKHGLKIASVNRCNLKTAFHGKLKDNSATSEISGIYKIECANCDKIYIGQTRRRIKTRFREHCRHIKNGDTAKSAVARHVIEVHHQIKPEVKLITSVKNRHVNIAENINIHKNRHRVMNEDLEGLRNIFLKSLDTGQRWNERPEPTATTENTADNQCH